MSKFNPHHSNANTTVTTWQQKLKAYSQLTRFDKPVGTELLLYPTLWAVFLASFGQSASLPRLNEVLVFTLGAVFMRAAGCAINDFADRNFDGQVTRTKARPLATGVISATEALGVFLVLVFASASLLLFLPIQVFYWSFGAIILASVYPFMKRYTHLPQVVLGAAYSWSIPMAYVAITGKTGVWCWLLYAANLAWTVAYDTQYAMVDRPDDLQAGIKSTAILFGSFDVAIIVLLQASFLGLLTLVVHHYVGHWAWVLPVVLVPLFIKQFYLCKARLPSHCFTAFLSNVWVGRVTFLVLLGVVLILSF